MNSKIKAFLGVLAFLTMFFSALVWADSNGVWLSATDITGGTFGSDEGSPSYTFDNGLNVNGDLAVDTITSRSGGNVVIQLS